MFMQRLNFREEPMFPQKAHIELNVCEARVFFLFTLVTKNLVEVSNRAVSLRTD